MGLLPRKLMVLKPQPRGSLLALVVSSELGVLLRQSPLAVHFQNLIGDARMNRKLRDVLVLVAFTDIVDSYPVCGSGAEGFNFRHRGRSARGGSVQCASEGNPYGYRRGADHEDGQRRP